MKKLKGSAAAKVAALILFWVLALGLVASAMGSVLLESWGAYSEDYETTRANAMNELAYGKLYEAYDMYMNGMELEDIDTQTNFRFSIQDANGKNVFYNYKNEDIICRVITSMEPRYSVQYTESAAGTQNTKRTVIVEHRTGERLEFETDAEFVSWVQENTLRVTGYVLSEMSANDSFSQRDTILSVTYNYRYALIGAAAGCLAAMLLLLCFMLSAAGHRKDSDEIVLSFVDKIPLDVFATGAVIVILMPLMLLDGVSLSYNILGYIIFSLCVIWMAGLILISLMSLAVRIKSGTLWKNCLCLRFIFWCWRLVKSFFAFLREMLRTKPLDRRWTIYIVGALFVEAFLMMASEFNEAMLMFLWFVNLVLMLGLLIWGINGFIKLRRGAKELAGGSLTCSIDTRYMRGELLEHANDLMNIREGMNRAVAERMKSERFQSELITNVSHDIKTPLTSIVNYVDLLAKEELDNEKAREYVLVLIRQSEKLKKLIGDLIEASKASTGVLAVNSERIELGVLIDQCAGEYKERLENAGLKLMVSKPKEPVAIMADGRHMWRIFDNLMNNVIKYAQPGTRVYLSLGRQGDKAEVTFRNISRDELSQSAEELMERFVRGDSSRSGEGSGLGLAIARSLAQLQGGEMSLNLDGDLFKVMLKFDIASPV